MVTDAYLKSLQSRAFVDGGMYVLRSEMSYLLFVAHKVGVFSTGPHKHNDTLSLEWCVGKQPVFVDSGTGCYTSDLIKKNRYRSTKAHNTIVVDGEEQIPITSAMFALNDIAGDVEIIDWLDDELKSEVSAKHTYYMRLSEPVIHERTISLNKVSHQATIKDVVSGVGIHKVEWYFHLAPGLKAIVMGKHFVISLGSNKVADLRFPEAINKAQVVSGTISQSYNKEVGSHVLYCRCDVDSRAEKTFLFHMTPTL